MRKLSDAMDNINVHQYYIDIINCMPHIVYWIDINGNLQGCNTGFINLLHLKHMTDFSGTPYETMRHRLSWDRNRIEDIRKDDLNALFLGKAMYNLEEKPISDDQGHLTYYRSTRVPLFNSDKQIIGLVVIFMDETDRKRTQTTTPSSKLTPPVSFHTRIDPKQPIQILLIEESPLIQHQEKILFEAYNCHVDVAATGDEAIALFTPGKYALVITDIRLKRSNTMQSEPSVCEENATVSFDPESFISGYVIAKTFRKIEHAFNLIETKASCRVPIITLTKHLPINVEHDCRHYDIEGIITKPLSEAQALQLIRYFIFNEPITVDGFTQL